LPRHLVSVRKDLAPALTKGLEKVLLSMHEDPEGVRYCKKPTERQSSTPYRAVSWRFANGCSTPITFLRKNSHRF
jgi:hypothetical protein